VLHGRWRARGVNAGQRFDYTARFLSVYVKRDGRWQMVAAQSTPIPDPA
jgi:ketosteroid isomerase-like protein